MFKYIKLLVLLLCFFGCNPTNSRPLSIQFSADSTHILIRNISPAGLLQIKNYLAAHFANQNLVAVLQSPANDDSLSMELDWPGQLQVVGAALMFTPKQPFIKGKSYIVQTIINTQFATGKEIIQANVGHKVKTQQQVLRR